MASHRDSISRGKQRWQSSTETGRSTKETKGFDQSENIRNIRKYKEKEEKEVLCKPRKERI